MGYDEQSPSDTDPAIDSAAYPGGTGEDILGDDEILVSETVYEDDYPGSVPDEGDGVDAVEEGGVHSIEAGPDDRTLGNLRRRDVDS